MAEKITVKFKTINSGTFELNVEKNIGIVALRHQLVEVSKVEFDRQRLIFRGKVLKDEAKLSDFGIEDNDTIHLIVRKEDAPAPAPAAAPAAAAASTASAAPVSATAAPVAAAPPALAGLNQVLNNVLGGLGGPNVSVNVMGAAIRPDGSMQPLSATDVMQQMQQLTGAAMAMPGASGAPAASAASAAAAAAAGSPQAGAAAAGAAGAASAMGLPPLLTCDQVRDTLNGINADLATTLQTYNLQPASAADERSANPQGPLSSSDVSGTLINAEQTLTALNRLTPALRQLIDELHAEPHMVNVEQRRRLDQLSEQVGMGMRRLGAVVGQVGRRLCMLQSADQAPGQAMLNANAPAAAPQPFVGGGGSNMLMIQADVPMISGLGGLAGAANAGSLLQQMQQQLAQAGLGAGFSVAPAASPAAPAAAPVPAPARAPVAQAAPASSAPGAVSAAAGAAPAVAGVPNFAAMFNSMLQQQRPSAASATQPATQPPSAASTPAPASAPAARPGQPDLSALFNMLGGAAAGAHPSSAPAFGAPAAASQQQAQSQPQAQAQSPPPSNPLGAMLGAMMGPQGGAGAIGSQQQSNPLGAMLGAMMGPQAGAGAANGQAANPLGAMLGAMMGPQGAAGAGANNGANNGGNAPNLASLMQSMMPMVGQMLGGAGGAGGMDLSALMGAAGAGARRRPQRRDDDMDDADNDDEDGDEEEEEEEEGGLGGGLLEQLMHLCMTELSMPELLGLVASGNLAPIEKLQQPLRDLVDDNLEEDNEDNRTELADSWAAELASLLSADNLPEVATAQLLPGADLSDQSFDYLRWHMLELVKLLRGPVLQPSAASPTPFADVIKHWAMLCFGGWLDALSNSFRDGMQSVMEVMKIALTAKLNVLGPQFAFMSQMAGGMLTGYVQRLHQAYRQHVTLQAATAAAMVSSSSSSSSGSDGDEANESVVEMLASEKWAQLLPADERLEWCRTIAFDLKRQHATITLRQQQQSSASSSAASAASSSSSSTKDFSESYLTGQVKRRKVQSGIAVRVSSSSSASSSSSPTSSSSDDVSMDDVKSELSSSSPSSSTSSSSDGESSATLLQRELGAAILEALGSDEDPRKTQTVLDAVQRSNLPVLFQQQIQRDLAKQ